MAATVAGLAAVAALIWFFIPASTPRVTGITQITHDGFPIGHMLTDGPRIYVTQFRPDGLVLAQVSTTGGESSVIPAPLKTMSIADISPDRSQLLVNTGEGTGTRVAPFWILPLPTGSLRRLGDIAGSGASWSPDGRQLVFIQGADLYLANADGTGAHLLVSAPGYAFAAAFSPDGKRIRFSVGIRRTQLIVGGSNRRIQSASTTEGMAHSAAGMLWSLDSGRPLLHLR